MVALLFSNYEGCGAGEMDGWWEMGDMEGCLVGEDGALWGVDVKYSPG